MIVYWFWNALIYDGFFNVDSGLLLSRIYVTKQLKSAVLYTSFFIGHKSRYSKESRTPFILNGVVDAMGVMLGVCVYKFSV